MRHRTLLVAASLALLARSSAPAQTPADLAETARYVAAAQNPDGGFPAKAGGPSTLAATSSAIRTLGFVGGSIKDVLGAIAYVESCVDPATGGFAPSPGGKAEVLPTAVGLMAIAALKLDPEPYAAKAVAYLSSNAKSFDDVRIAVAGLEAIRATSPEFPRWIEVINANRNPDGTFGEGVVKARETGGRAVALLRSGVKLDRREAVLGYLRESQGAAGGWSETGETPDLGTTYRIMRCFFMLGESPDLGRLRGYLARQRQSDGGYSATPGGPADGGGTYYCSVMLRWARLLDGEPALIETAGFVPLVDGATLAGWDGDASLWSVDAGKVVGRSTGLDHNEFLATNGTYADFIVQATFRMRGDESSNSGIMFRSARLPGHEMAGYQADIGQGFWGCLYDESRRNKVLAPADPKAVEKVRRDAWNHYAIRAMGPEIVQTLNGVNSLTYREPDAGIARDGKIALQVHAGKVMTVEFKNLLVQALPIPKADDDDTPGFHLRSVETAAGPRKYSVYLPTSYDAGRSYPAVLFLHGSGERGDDGVRSAQIGLGAAIALHPEAFPAIAVFPQAAKTWAADSDDIKAALAALEAVRKRHKVDANRIALTGLSMGGAGSWGLAASRPELFSAVVPICGPGRVDSAAKFKGVPTWFVCGDEDRVQTLRNGRAMVRAIKEAGGSARLTEYRAVGHNSWDRAYNDLALLDWLVAQRRQGSASTGG